MKIAIGSDHPGFSRKHELIEYLKSKGHEIFDCGTYTDKIKTHYPIYGRDLSILVVENKVDIGIAICGTGVGIANSCNKVKGIRCSLVRDPLTAKIAKEKYNANVISFGARIVGIGEAIMIVDTFLNSKYNNKNDEFVNTLNNEISVFNNDKHLFDDIIENWEKGKYTEGVLQDKIVMPKI